MKQSNAQLELGIRTAASPKTNPKTLAVVRHGDYSEPTLRIDEAGIREMVALSAKLGPYLEGKTVRLVVSTAPRAVDSALVLVARLKLVSFEAYAGLWSDNAHHQDNDAALALIGEKFKDADVLIVVTHLEYSEDLPVLYVRQAGPLDIGRQELGKGQARIICFDGVKLLDRTLP